MCRLAGRRPLLGRQRLAGRQGRPEVRRLLAALDQRGPRDRPDRPDRPVGPDRPVPRLRLGIPGFSVNDGGGAVKNLGLPVSHICLPMIFPRPVIHKLRVPSNMAPVPVTINMLSVTDNFS